MPLAIFWIILLTGIALCLLKRKRTGLIFCFYSIVWLAMISFPFVPRLLVKSLENRFPPLTEISQIQSADSIHILILGGGYTSNKALPPNDQLELNSLGRLLEGIRLHRLLPASIIILSGSLPVENISEAELFKQTALDSGVEKKEIKLLSIPQNTRMEALEYTGKFGTDKRLILVTDAIHMPRAMFLFQKAGQKPIPAPTNHMVKSDRRNGISDWGPSAENIDRMEYAMHEIFGLARAKIRVSRR